MAAALSPASPRAHPSSTQAGVRTEITILISDIRSFTTLTETIEPPTLVAMLNRYFEPITDAVIEFGGRVDKFLGDGMIAEFNMPEPQEHHALRAVLAALRIREQITLFNQAQATRGEPPIRMGIGIHTGNAIVGRIGPPGKFLDYTAMGDAVNVASRLQDQTKAIQHDVVISDAVYTRVREWVGVGPPMALQIKGRLEPVTAYRLDGLRPGLSLDGALLDAAGRAPVVPGVEGRGNIPAHPTPILGRAREIAQVHDLLLRPDVRLLTLHGAAGIGKSSLALHAASRARHAFAGGVFFVPLGEATGPEFVLRAVAELVGVQETRTQPLQEALAAALQGQSLLVVLDGFDQVMAATPQILDLLAAVPGLNVLVTSRVPLRRREEWEVVVPPLAVPETDQLTQQTLLDYASVRLFTERARQARESFALTEDNGRVVARICRQLDGNPAAIEFVASLVQGSDVAGLQYALEYANLQRERAQQEVMRHELAQAWEVQRLLMPAALPNWPGVLEVAHRFSPARQTSGDFYDVFEAGAGTTVSEDVRSLQIAVGDVAGKGMSAALVMAIAQTALHAAVEQSIAAHGATRRAVSPAAVLRSMGQALHRRVGARIFVACALAVVEREANAGLHLRLANGAQVPPLLWRSGTVTELIPPGDRLPLGVVPSTDYADLTCTLAPGNVVVFASDGLPEAPAAVSGEYFGFERLSAATARAAAQSQDADTIAGAIWDEVLAWAGDAPQQDDMTLVVLRVPHAT